MFYVGENLTEENLLVGKKVVTMSLFIKGTDRYR